MRTKLSNKMLKLQLKGKGKQFMQVPGYSRDQKANSELKGLKMQKQLTTRTNYANKLNQTQS